MSDAADAEGIKSVDGLAINFHFEQRAASQLDYANMIAVIAQLLTGNAQAKKLLMEVCGRMAVDVYDDRKLLASLRLSIMTTQEVKPLEIWSDVILVSEKFSPRPVND